MKGYTHFLVLKNWILTTSSPDWCCRIHRQDLCSGVRLRFTPSVLIDFKQSNSEDPALDIWGMRSIPSLTWLLCLLWPGVVALDRVPSFWSKRSNCVQKITDVNLWLLHCNTWNHITVQKRAQALFKNIISKMKIIWKKKKKKKKKKEVARGVMVIVLGNGHGDTSSNSGLDWLHVHIALIPLGKVWIQLFSLQLWVNSRTDRGLQPWRGNYSRRRKTLNSNLLNSAKKLTLCHVLPERRGW